MKITNNRRGFTLAEMVIVLVVIGILAAIFIPSMTSLMNRTNSQTGYQ